MPETSRYQNGPVPDREAGFCYSDAGGIALDAGVQLCKRIEFPYSIKKTEF